MLFAYKDIVIMQVLDSLSNCVQQECRRCGAVVVAAVIVGIRQLCTVDGPSKAKLRSIQRTQQSGNQREIVIQECTWVDAGLCVQSVPER
jgi:hypothetical protein